MEEGTRSIGTLFLNAESRRQEISNLSDTNSSAYQGKLAIAITTYEECLELSEQASLFSPNETLDDVSSSDLQYMAINWQLAELMQRITGDVAARKANLLKARSYFERFLKLLDSYDMLGRSDSRLFELYLEDRDQFSTASIKDAAARRDAKIARFREEKELKRKLEHLRQNPKLAEHDEQVVRELNFTNLMYMVHQTFQSLESLAMELHIISLAPPAPPENQRALRQDARDSERGNRDDYSDRLDGQLPGLKFSGPILSADGRPLRPFTLTSNRQVLKKGVFRPDHNLPTMSIDEYLDEEKRRGGIIEGGGEQSGIRPDPDEDDLAKADEETMKARAWDEYVEANPKGSGNTMNRG